MPRRSETQAIVVQANGARSFSTVRDSARTGVIRDWPFFTIIHDLRRNTQINGTKDRHWYYDVIFWIRTFVTAGEHRRSCRRSLLCIPSGQSERRKLIRSRCVLSGRELKPAITAFASDFGLAWACIA